METAHTMGISAAAVVVVVVAEEFEIEIVAGVAEVAEVE